MCYEGFGEVADQGSSREGGRGEGKPSPLSGVLTQVFLLRGSTDRFGMDLGRFWVDLGSIGGLKSTIANK